MNTIDIEYNNGLRLFSFFKDDNNCTQKCDEEEYCGKCCEMYYVNLKKIKKYCENKFLKDAYCFQLLFGFKSGSFKNEDKLFNFRKFHITYSHWSAFLTFLENGQRYLKLISQEKLLQLVETCNKFGGIPYFDKEFKKRLVNLENENIDKELQVKKPEDDVNNFFTWKVVLDHQLPVFYNSHPDYSYSGYSQKKNEITTIFYFKKLKQEYLEKILSNV